MFLASLKKAEARGFTPFIVCFMGKILLAPLFKPEL
jgi:hypothetical protein